MPLQRLVILEAGVAQLSQRFPDLPVAQADQNDLACGCLRIVDVDVHEVGRALHRQQLISGQNRSKLRLPGCIRVALSETDHRCSCARSARSAPIRAYCGGTDRADLAGLTAELASLRAENARLLRLLKLTQREAAPPGPAQAGFFDAPPGPVHAGSSPKVRLAFFG
jgi:hypothetical protein